MLEPLNRPDESIYNEATTARLFSQTKEIDEQARPEGNRDKRGNLAQAAEKSTFPSLFFLVIQKC